jgi:hypothetical protein
LTAAAQQLTLPHPLAPAAGAAITMTPASAFTQAEGLIAAAAAAAFLLLVALLHFIRPQLAPSWHMISEYAVGRSGWVMQLAFYCLAAGCLTAALAVTPYTSGHAGTVLLIIATIGAAGAGFFITDPAGLVKSSSSPTHVLHVVFSFVLIPVFPVAATVVTASLRHGAPHAIYGGLPWLTAAAWLGLAGFMISSMYFQRGGRKLGPGTPVGYLQRFMVLTYAAWLIVMGVGIY